VITPPDIEWHGDKAYARCWNCDRLVRLNKLMFGSAHICATPCEARGRHVGPIETTTHRFLWRRWKTLTCTACLQVEQIRIRKNPDLEEK